MVGAIKQFLKFAVVGVTSVTIFDLGVLNLLMFITGIFSGIYFAVFKAISFLMATISSYLLNKFWTFGSKTPVRLKEYGVFALFATGGALINVGVASFVVNVIGPQWGVLPKVWANIGAIVAVVFSMTWNFLSYRYIVFRSSALGN